MISFTLLFLASQTDSWESIFVTVQMIGIKTPFSSSVVQDHNPMTTEQRKELRNREFLRENRKYLQFAQQSVRYEQLVNQRASRGIARSA